LIGYATLCGTIVNGFLLLSVVATVGPQLSIISKRLLEILDSKITIYDGNEKKINDSKGTIEFKNVSFKYQGAKDNILSNISFSANSGEFIGIIGPTGSGKTTLLNLLPRFADPTTGEILIDGSNIKNYKLTTLRDKIGFSQQRASLLNRSVYNNIGLKFDKQYSEESTKKIDLASDVSQSKSFIEKLENKFDTIISQSASNISGGQKQRIAIARTIVDAPEIMIFDDSFSALDATTDLNLRKQLFSTYHSSTKIVASSRVSTIKNANKIIVIDAGKIIDIGTHKKLFSSCGLYKEIVLSQMTLEEAKNG
jgi:ATP-binding cassette subfamily B protein